MKTSKNLFNKKTKNFIKINVNKSMNMIIKA